MSILAAAFGAYATIIFLYFYILQEKLLFQLQPLSEETVTAIKERFPEAEEIKIKTPDGTALHGWFVKNSTKEKSPAIIYFGGNAEEASNLIPDFKRFTGWSAVLINYRGYGKSEGSPSEENFFKDALFIYDVFSGREDVDAGRIVGMGRSLGTAVAVHLAAERPLKGVILVSPYDSISSVAAEKYPFVPVNLLIKHPFNALSRAPDIKTPLLAFVGTADTLITPEHSMRLIESWGGEKTVKIMEGKDHNDIMDNEEYPESIKEWLAEISR